MHGHGIGDDDDGINVTILGCTLHSHVPPEAREVVRQKVNDFRRIADWTVDDHVAEHARDVAWLRHELLAISGAQCPAAADVAVDASTPEDRQAKLQAGRRRAGRRVIVVTHHAPMVRGTSHPQHVGSPWSSAFATPLLDDDNDASGGDKARVFSAVDCWIFGHTHYSTDFLVGGTRLVSNQRGYVLPGATTRADDGSKSGKDVGERVDGVARGSRFFGRLVASAGLSRWLRSSRGPDAEDNGAKAIENVFDVHKVIDL
jgi:hypothetical protein